MSFGISAGQVAVMFLLMGLGWAAYQFRWFRGDAVKGMTNLLLYIVSPAVIIQAFQRPFDAGELRTIGIVFLVDVAAFAITIALAQAIFTRRLVPDAARRVALRFGTVYSNAGFMGIPLAQAILGDDGVFYAVAYIAAFTIFVWTHGVAVFGGSGEDLRQRTRRVLLNPNLVAIVVALALFVLSIGIPSPFADAIGHVAAMNTPLSMIVVGSNLAALSLRTIFNDGWVWLGAVVRNVVVPVIFVGLLALLPIDPVARLSVLIPVATPVAAFLVIFSMLHDRDPRFATRLMCLSTLLSVVTLPGVLVLAGAVW